MFIHSRLSLADTNLISLLSRPIVYLGVGDGSLLSTRGLGKRKNSVAIATGGRERKTISFDVGPQVAWWCKVTHQPGGGGGGGGSDEPLEAPLGLPLSNYVYV